MRTEIIRGDCLEALKTLPDASVHCCVTSPPYWGLRDYGHDGQIGLEATPEAYVARMVEVFREVRRVLRDDGTLWLNIGDSYAAARGGTSMPAETLAGGVSGKGDECAKRGRESGYTPHRDPAAHGLKHKDLVGIPWRVAFALQADGWYLRQDIIWHKPNPMPESVRDRCTKAHEYVFLLAKSERYFYDTESVAEEATNRPSGNKSRKNRKEFGGSADHPGAQSFAVPWGGSQTRNRRSVWPIATKPYKGAHFATMPPQLAELCILAGTSADGCCSECGAPRERVVERERVPTRPGADTKVAGDSMTDGNRDPQRHVTSTKTVGWQATCEHTTGVSPCVVLDPFSGSGTTLAVAVELGRDGVGCELNPEYIKLAEKRIHEVAARMPLFA